MQNFKNSKQNTKKKDKPTNIKKYKYNEYKLKKK